MRVTRKLVLSAALFAAFLAGCKKKHPVQPVAPPPVLQPQTVPPAQTTQTPTQNTGQAPASQPGSSTAQTQPAKPKPKRIRRPVNTKPVPKKPAPVPAQSAASNEVPRITIADGSRPNAPGDLSASLPHTDEEHARETTAQLIAGAELNLKGITRQLSADEQNTLAQIRSFILQSQQATREGDDFRAHNLALKAHLLSDALAGAR